MALICFVSLIFFFFWSEYLHQPSFLVIEIVLFPLYSVKGDYYGLYPNCYFYIPYPFCNICNN